MYVADVMCWPPRHNQKHTVYFLSMKTKCAICSMNNVSRLEGYTQPAFHFCYRPRELQLALCQ